MILRDQFATFEITILTALKPETFMNISQSFFGVERSLFRRGEEGERFEKAHSMCPVANIVKVDFVLVIKFISFVLRIAFFVGVDK